MAMFRPLLLLAMVGLSGTSLAALWQPAFPDVPLPDNARVRMISDGMQMNSLHTRIFEVDFDLPPAAVVEHFHAIWQKEMVLRRLGQQVFVSHRENDWLIAIQLERTADSTTRGLVSITDIFDAMDTGRTQAGLPYPMPEGSQVLQQLQAEDVGRHSETLILTNTESVHQNLEYYRSWAQEQGYAPVTRGALIQGMSGGAMILNRGAEQLNLAAAARGGQTVIAIVRVQQ